MKWLQDLPRWLVWGLALPLLALNGWIILQAFEYFRQFISVFIGANLFAFLLNYSVRLLQRWGFSRSHAVFLVLMLSVAGILILGVTLIPVLVDQVNGLVRRLPEWVLSGNDQINTFQQWVDERRLPLNFFILVRQVQENFAAQVQAASGQIVGLGLGLAGGAVDFIFMVVLTFYLLLYGDRLWEGIFRWLPQDWGTRLRYNLRQSFHNYFSGQASLAVLIGLALMLVFLVLKVPFSLLFGFIVGLMTLIPLGAPLTVMLVSSLVALTDVWLGIKVLAVGLLVEQAIENIIAPRLLGRFTGLNPVWVLVALLLGTRIAGLLGLLVAIPIAGFIKTTLDMVWTERDEASSL